MPAQGLTSVEKQQREFVRIDDMLPFAWTIIPEEEISKILLHYEKHREFPAKTGDVNALLSSMDIGDKLKLLERDEPNLARILSRLDMKLNFLIRLFHPGEQQQPLVPTPINLSGGGLAFWERDVPLAIGEVLHVRLALSPDALAVIECYARIVHVRHKDQNDLDKVACNFEPILSQDRESIIQHIFKRQAERLRAKKQV
ncbi:MAG: PilZ domain-containing protein [Magnetococcales bacterium]|nr:PilZ domain-containing protein [Magnetococcales bacterium]MBF0322499.1 PilZ domain-containing protein [Magnetococcales bacterium]